MNHKWTPKSKGEYNTVISDTTEAKIFVPNQCKVVKLEKLAYNSSLHNHVQKNRTQIISWSGQICEIRITGLSKQERCA